MYENFKRGMIKKLSWLNVRKEMTHLVHLPPTFTLWNEIQWDEGS